MVSTSSEAMPARWPPHSLACSRISLAMTSSFFCASPCTLSVPASPSTPASAPLETLTLIALHRARDDLDQQAQVGGDAAGALLLDQELGKGDSAHGKAPRH